VSGARRGRSLFWVIAGALLLTAIVGTFAQTLVIDAVLRPLESREHRTRATLAVSRLGAEFAAWPEKPDSAAIAGMLARIRADMELRYTAVLYLARAGGMVAVPEGRGGQAIEWVLRGPVSESRPDRGAGGHRPRPFSVLARGPANWGGTRLGEFLVVRPSRPSRGPGGIPYRPLLLSLPIVFAASLVVGLIIVRMLVRRLRALETLASRVAGGDLSARVEDRSGDEIGRLAQRLNTMTDHLAAARGAATQQESQRQKLFADITHELATPLTSIRGCTETLLDPNVPLSELERSRYLDDILAASRRLDRLIRDLFDLARLEAGASPFEVEKLDWVALCRNVAQRFGERFEAAGLRLEWTESVEVAWIEADGHRMEQVLENLLRNELRYVPAPATVGLSVVEARDSEGRLRFRLTVSDDGPGMPPEELTRAFERFYRSTDARERESPGELEGSGLGLAIVREIVQRHGGTAVARASSPRGLAIEIELPAAG
jgi:signal transduction histidine kinase